MLAWVCLRLWNSLRGAHAAPIPGQIIRRERLALNRGEDERLSLNLAKPELKSKLHLLDLMSPQHRHSVSRQLDATPAAL
jgi:hypothetical protein